jgi:hypothetical protein
VALVVAARARDAWREGVLLFWLFAPYVIAQIQSRIGTPSLTMQNLFVSTPAFYLLVARGFTRLPQGAVLGASFASAVLLHLVLGRQEYAKDDAGTYRGLTHAIVAQPTFDPGDVVVSCGSPYFDYYFERATGSPQVDTTACSAKQVGRIQAALKNSRGGELWLLKLHDPLDAALVSWLDKRFGKAERVGVGTANYRRYTVKPAPKGQGRKTSAPAR